MQDNQNKVVEEVKFESLPEIKDYVSTFRSSEQPIKEAKEAFDYNFEVVEYEAELLAKSKDVENEFGLIRFLAPFLGAIAVGLRLTKVTAQLREGKTSKDSVVTKQEPTSEEDIQPQEQTLIEAKESVLNIDHESREEPPSKQDASS